MLRSRSRLTFLGLALWTLQLSMAIGEESDPRREDTRATRPQPWPGGIVPYDLSALNEEQQKTVRLAMKRWEETGAKIRFAPRSNEAAHVFFTGRTDAGNNTSQVGFVPGRRVSINITAFWWRQGEWMPAHELGHALGFFHEHSRWDRDRHITVHYENIKPGRESDYNWIAKTNWITSATAYDYHSIMHYRVCWAGRCESECKDGKGDSPCAVLDPIGTEFDGVIGQWGTNRISPGDATKARLVYGTAE
jgi:hypothetical protein